MTILQLIILAVGLSMDAFAVSICKGLELKDINYNKSIKIALYFGLFQGLMPLIGYLLGNIFKDVIINLDHWLAFGLLSFIGINLIKDSNTEIEINDKIDFKSMILLSIATSIDALAVGITLSVLKINIIISVLIICIITFINCFIGTIIGNKLGNKISKSAKIIGGIILIITGLKILIEHLT
jgi:putative Mn2+ efflux pump MntP